MFGEDAVVVVVGGGCWNAMLQRYLCDWVIIQWLIIIIIFEAILCLAVSSDI